MSPLTIPPPSAGSGGVRGWGASLATNDVGGFGTFGAQDKCAIYDATSNTTFVCFYGSDFWLTAMSFDHATRRWDGPVKISAPPVGTEFDAHGVPSLAIDDQGTIHGFYGSHDTQPIYFKSSAPRTINGGWTMPTISVGIGTYHQGVWEPTTTALYAFFRSGTGHGAGYPHHEYGGIVRSLDHGATWTEISAGGTAATIDLTGYNSDTSKDFYVMGAEADGAGKIYFAWTIAHGVNHDAYREDVYCAAYNVADGHFYTAGGTDLGVTIAGSTEIGQCKAAASGRMGLCRMMLNSGKPVIVYPQQALAPASVSGAIVDTFSGEADAADLSAHKSEKVSWAKAPAQTDALLVSAAGELYQPGNTFPVYLAHPTLGPDQSIHLDLNVLTTGVGRIVAWLRCSANPASAVKYGAFYDASTGNLALARYNAANAGTGIGNTVAVGALTAGVHSLDFSVTGTSLSASIDGGTASIATDATIPGAGQVGVRVAQSDLTTGIHVTGMSATGTPMVGSTQVARWTGSAWATADTGARHHHFYELPGIYKDENSGDLIVFAPTGRSTTDPPTYNPVTDDAIIYNRLGGDVTAYRSTDGGATWTRDAKILGRRQVRGQGISAVAVPRGAKKGLRALALAASMTPYIGANGSGANRINGRLGLYAITDDADDATGQLVDSAPVEQFIELVTVRQQVVPPTAGSWVTLDLSSYVPENVTDVRLRFNVIGSGSAGQQAIRVRRKGTNYTSGEWDFAARGEITDGQIFTAWTPVGRDGLLEWQRITAATGIATVGISLAGFRTG